MNHLELISFLYIQAALLEARTEHLMDLRSRHSTDALFQLLADRKQTRLDEEMEELTRKMIMIPNSN